MPVELLVIEDSPTQAEQLRFLLEENGYRVRVAGNGTEGLALAHELRPDLVISDVMMPQMDGYEFCRAIRSDPSLCDIPVVLLTSFASVQNIVRGLECGAHNFLRKPYDAEYLIQRVRFLIEGIQRRRHSSPLEGLGLILADAVESREADREQILDLLVSTYDQAIRMNAELSRQRDSLTQWQYRLAAMHQLAVRVSESGSFMELLDNAAHELLQFPGVDAVVIGTNEPRRRVEHSRQDSPLLNRDRSAEPTPLSFPLQVNGRMLGSLMVTMGDTALPDLHDRTLLATMADRIAAALERLNILATLEDRVRERTAALMDEIAERRRSEQQLRLSEERYRLLFERNLAGIVRTTLDGRVLGCNPAFARLIGYDDPAEVEGIAAAQYWAAIDDRKPIIDQVRRDGQISNQEIQLQRRDGTQVIVLGNITLTSLEDGRPVLETTLVDLTEHKHLEEQLRQAQKMESLGLLAGGIAHDFNNLLTIISGYTDVLREKIEGEDDMEKAVNGIRSAVMRAAALTRKLLAFSRNQIMKRESIDLNDLIVNDTEIFRRLLPREIELELQPEPSMAPVDADRNQLEQVLLNLLVNARDAMAGGGRITITTRVQVVSAAEIPPNTKALPGSFAVLSVRDSGCGINESVLARIFEPFFSTKGEKGTGLGLSTVHGIVVQTGGFIRVESKVGQGTTFLIFLPLAVSREDTGNAPAIAAALPPPSGPVNILLVEDEEDILAMMSDFLSWKGYTVLTSNDPFAAVELSRTLQNPLHLLITDMNLPGMDGGRLAREIRALHPDMRVLFASGQTDKDLNQILAELSGAFLAKPFTAQQLHEAVKDLVEGKSIPAPSRSA